LSLRPMRTWLSFNFYPLETQDVFLQRALRPFLAQYIWPTKGAHAFFIRYDDEKGPHIRLRLQGEPAWLEDTLRPALAGWFLERGEWLESAYEPEPERFGGADSLILAEEYFHFSTRIILDRLAREPRTHGDTLFDALRLHLLTAMGAGMIREKAAWYFGKLCQQWLPVFFRPTDGQPLDEILKTEILAKFESSLAPQRTALQSALQELWTAAGDSKFDDTQPEWRRWLRGNELILKEFGGQLDKALPSLLHLTNNRLGVNNQDEVFLCYVLANTL
ncbi:MAG: thiopeptide-type bacteriocin biosynthesis protein, partial [Saprospiraceae bacterium]